MFSLFYMWVPDVEVSIARVAARVRNGGHDIPEDVIRRRYVAGLRNFFHIYMPLADLWGFYVNTNFGQPDIIAESDMSGNAQIYDAPLWQRVQEIAGR